jgi:hypothetical protein
MSLTAFPRVENATLGNTSAHTKTSDRRCIVIPTIRVVSIQYRLLQRQKQADYSICGMDDMCCEMVCADLSSFEIIGRR